MQERIFDLNERHDNMDENLPNKNFFSNNFIVDILPVCYCNNLIIGHSFYNILVVQTQET